MIQKPMKKMKLVKKTGQKSKLVARKVRAPKAVPQVLQISKSALKVAFIGRSNVGKSSLINFLLGQKIAKTSKHPGKTREHSLFRFSDKISFVDMPGYGYALIRKERRQQWDQDLLKLFFEDTDLEHVFVLVDISIPPMKIDQDFVSWLFTKKDKAKLNEKTKYLTIWQLHIASLGYPFELKIFEVSSLKKQGAGELKEFIGQIKKQV
jgi:GTP-binding protein